MNGRLDGKGGLSPKSLRLHKNVLFQALTDAVRNQLLSSNPCQFVQLPQKERKEAHFYSATQMQTLFATLQNDPLLPLVKITAIYGLRRSELLGLQWDSIDEERGTLAICHTVVKVTSAVEKDKTKNRTSRRAFPLTPEARAIFAEAKRKEIENRRLFGADYIRTLALVRIPAALYRWRRIWVRPQRRRVETRPPIFFLLVFHKIPP